MPTTTDVQNISLSGGSVLAIFKNKPEYAGKDNVHLIDENLTPRKYAEILGRALGVQVTAKDFSQTDLASQAQSENVFVREFYLDMKYFADYCQPESGFYDEAGSLNTYPKRSDFEKFVKENDKFKAFAASLA